MIAHQAAVGPGSPSAPIAARSAAPETRPQMQIRITRLMRYLKLNAGRKSLTHRCRAVLAVAALVVLASCSSDDSLGTRYPVYGTVTYNGNPLESGQISFVSEDLKSNIGATGQITKGSYSLSTGGGDDGAQVGKYKVTITAKEDYRAKAKADFEREAGKERESAYIPPQFVAKAEASAKSLIPLGYGDVRTSKLTAEVKAERNKIDFDLSDKDAPPDPPAPAKGRGGGRRGS